MKSASTAFRWLVVGGGAAGCHVAHRLASSGLGSVALLEAGNQSHDPRTWVPAWYPRAQGRQLDWAFRTEPQSQLGGRRLAWPRGRCLGGSSAINGLIYMWPAEADVARWAQAVGGAWLTWLDRLAETTHVPATVDPAKRCGLTDISLRPVPETHPWCQRFLDAAEAWGLRRNDHWIQAAAGVCGNYWLTIERARRANSATRLLEEQSLPAATIADQLTILTGISVQRILLQQGRAVGVLALDQQGQRLQLEAEDAVVLAAGTIGSATLLLRSGIGPAAHLRSAGIDCVVDAAEVGQNVQDHLVWPVVVRMRSPEGLPYRFDRAARARYRDSGSGPLSSNLAEVGAMFGHWNPAATICHRAAPAAPLFQVHVTPTHYLKYPGLPTTPDCMSLGLTPLHPNSRGLIRLDEADPDRPPWIDPRYLSAAGDIEHFEIAWEVARGILNQPALAGGVRERLLPAPHRSDSKGVRKSVSALAQSIYHPVGSCRAGRDATSVVDDHFRVRGVEGLRIADASVLPDLPSGNTCAATYLMAELAAAALSGQAPRLPG